MPNYVITVRLGMTQKKNKAPPFPLALLGYFPPHGMREGQQKSPSLGKIIR